MNELGEYELKPVVKNDYFIDPLAEEVIINPDKVLLLECSHDLFDRFSKSSNFHGRSIEDPNRLVINSKPIKDENGDIYTSFSIKGAEAAVPTATFYGIEPHQVRVNGMLDASTFTRCYEASKLLRREGVLTEWPIFHARPKLFPDGEGDIGLLKFKEMLYGNYVWQQDTLATKNKAYEPDHVGIAGAVGNGLLDMQFGVMYRVALSNIRLVELGNLNLHNQLNDQIASAIRSLQLRKPDYFNFWDDLEKLDSESVEDQRTYLTNILPRIMGGNLGRFHNTDSYHKYLHPGNWTLAGEIVDLDTVRNASIDAGDEVDITLDNRMDDFYSSMNTLEKIAEVTAWDPGKLAEVFTKAYFAERYLGENVSEFESIILESQLCPPFDSDPGDLGNPRIVDFSDGKIVEITSNGLSQAAEDAQQTKSFKPLPDYFIAAGLEVYVEAKVDEFLLKNGYRTPPWWIDKKRLVTVEIVKVMEVIAKSLEETAA